MPTEIYEETIRVVQGFYEKVGAGETPDIQPLFLQSDKLLQAIETLSAPLLALSREPYESNNLYRHTTNVAILSLTLGYALKLKPEKMIILARTSLLFDIGMMKMGGFEMAQIKEHPQIGAKILENFSGIPSDAIQATLQHHERRDGSGYPKGLKNEEIHSIAKIVGLADTFCNLAHVAPQQRKLSLHETMQELLQGKRLFDEKCLRALLENVNFYPKGTWVKLTTGEIGRVAGENPGMPLRPVVKIYCDSDGERLTEGPLVDLRRRSAVYIKAVLSEEKLIQKGIDPLWS